MNRPLPRDMTEDSVEFGEISGALGLLLRLAQVKVFEGFYDTLAHHGLRPGEYTMLWLIGLNPDTRQGVIARRLRIKPAHMTKLVGRAVDKGLVARHVPDDDRRSVYLRLTPDGERFVAERKPDFLKFVAHEGDSALDAAEFRTLIALLQKFNGMAQE